MLFAGKFIIILRYPSCQQHGWCWYCKCLSFCCALLVECCYRNGDSFRHTDRAHTNCDCCFLWIYNFIKFCCTLLIHVFFLYDIIQLWPVRCNNPYGILTPHLWTSRNWNDVTGLMPDRISCFIGNWKDWRPCLCWHNLSRRPTMCCNSTVNNFY